MISVEGNGKFRRKTQISQALYSVTVARSKGLGFRALHLCWHHGIVAVPWALTHATGTHLEWARGAGCTTRWHSWLYFPSIRMISEHKPLKSPRIREVGWVCLGIYTAALARHELSSRSLVTVVSKC